MPDTPEIAELAAERNALWAELAERDARERELADVRAELRRLEASASWRLTRPLRAAGVAAGALAEAIRRRRER